MFTNIVQDVSMENNISLRGPFDFLIFFEMCLVMDTGSTDAPWVNKS